MPHDYISELLDVEISVAEEIISSSTRFLASNRAYVISGEFGSIKPGSIYQGILRQIRILAKQGDNEMDKVDVKQRHFRLLPIFLFCTGVAWSAIGPLSRWGVRRLLFTPSPGGGCRSSTSIAAFSGFSKSSLLLAGKTACAVAVAWGRLAIYCK
jgi:hypothetical protein